MTDQPEVVVRFSRLSAGIFVFLSAAFLVAALVCFWLLATHPSGTQHPLLHLAPTLFLVMGCLVAWLTLRRMRDSSPLLTLSTTGIEVPRITPVPIRWADVLCARAVKYNWGKSGIRHYVYFEVDKPDSYNIRERTLLQSLFGGIPPDAPLVAIDLTDLDHDAPAIMEAVRRFQPGAVTHQAGRSPSGGTN